MRMKTISVGCLFFFLVCSIPVWGDQVSLFSFGKEGETSNGATTELTFRTVGIQRIEGAYIRDTAGNRLALDISADRLSAPVTATVTFPLVVYFTDLDASQRQVAELKRVTSASDVVIVFSFRPGASKFGVMPLQVDAVSSGDLNLEKINIVNLYGRGLSGPFRGEQIIIEDRGVLTVENVNDAINLSLRDESNHTAVDLLYEDLELDGGALVLIGAPTRRGSAEARVALITVR